MSWHKLLRSLPKLVQSLNKQPDRFSSRIPSSISRPNPHQPGSSRSLLHHSHRRSRSRWCSTSSRQSMLTSYRRTWRQACCRRTRSWSIPRSNSREQKAITKPSRFPIRKRAQAPGQPEVSRTRRLIKSTSISSASLL